MLLYWVGVRVGAPGVEHAYTRTSSNDHADRASDFLTFTYFYYSYGDRAAHAQPNGGVVHADPFCFSDHDAYRISYPYCNPYFNAHANGNVYVNFVSDEHVYCLTNGDSISNGNDYPNGDAYTNQYRTDPSMRAIEL